MESQRFCCVVNCHKLLKGDLQLWPKFENLISGEYWRIHHLDLNFNLYKTVHSFFHK